MPANNAHFVPVATNDYKLLLERNDVDIVSVCTPPAFHEEIVTESLKAGKYVICEKPLAANLAAADRIIEAADQFPNRTSVVYQNRYDDSFAKIRWAAEQGLLGRLLFGHCIRFSGLAGTSGARGGWWGNWKNAGGGVVTTQFIHHLDQLCCVFGTPAQVDATVGTLGTDIESEDTFSASIRFQNAAIVSCAATVTAPAFEYKLSVVGADAAMHLPIRLQANAGDKARIAKAIAGKFPARSRLDGTSMPIKVARKVATKLRRYSPPPTLHTRYIKEVLDAIDGGTELPSGPREAKLSLELCTAIYESGLTKKPVNLPLNSSSSYYAGITKEVYQAFLESEARSDTK